jgi:hypothetical protein
MFYFPIYNTRKVENPTITQNLKVKLLCMQKKSDFYISVFVFFFRAAYQLFCFIKNQKYTTLFWYEKKEEFLLQRLWLVLAI